MKRWLCAALLLTALAAGCADRRPAATIVVRGGPSLLRMFDGVAASFEREHPGTHVVIDFSCPPCVIPSTKGAGANVDVLISVGDRDVESLKQAGVLTPGPLAQFGTARLALVVPKESSITIRGLADLFRPEVRKIGIGNPDTTDLGHYTVLALRRAGVYKELPDKFVRARSGCELLKSLSLGVYDAAVVYNFCVSIEDAEAQRVSALSTRLYDPIPMYAVANTTSEAPDLAQQFVDYVASPAAAPMLKAKGVEPVMPASAGSTPKPKS